MITGAGGFVGSHLVRALEKSASVIALKRSDVDLASEKAVSQKLSGLKIDVVIHAASQQPRPGISLTADDFHRGNVVLLENILKVLPEALVIHFSTAAVYQELEGKVLNEESPIHLVGDYAISKRRSEELLEERKTGGSICFRMPSVFGAGQPGGIVPTYYEAAVNNEDVEVFSRGKLFRNLLHLDDVARACSLAIHQKISDHRLFLLGSRDSLTMEDIATLMIRKTGSRSRVILSDKKPPVAAHWNLLVKKVSEFLDFSPMSIEEGIEKYFQGMKKGMG